MKYRLLLGWLLLPRRFDTWCPGCARYNNEGYVEHFVRCTLYGRAGIDETYDNSDRWLGRINSGTGRWLKAT